MKSPVDIAVVGAGAAGLAAAIFAAETRTNLKVVLLDGARTIGAKILVSGGGRCNVTNAAVHPSDFHAPPRLVGRILQRFDEQATVQWFRSLGVELKQEPAGKLFPVSNKARTVLNALLQRCHELGITISTKCRVQSIVRMDTGFHIQFEQGQIPARRVIMATGGQSLPKTGSDGQGWTLARRLGHSVIPAHPALVPLILSDNFIHAGLSGISHEVKITTRVDRKVVDHRLGSLLWTHFGVSGPVVLDASRFWVIAKEQSREATMSISCCADQTSEEVDRWLSHASRRARGKSAGALLAQRLPVRLAKALCLLVDQGVGDPIRKQVEPNGSQNLASMPLNQLPKSKRKILVRVLTDLPLPVIGHRGWNYAEVTAGGIPLREINPRTMMSRKVPGFYLIGEMLDCDGRIGGFNFQWAWSTGYIAGKSAATSGLAES